MAQYTHLIDLTTMKLFSIPVYKLILARQVDPEIQKSQTVEALNVNKSINQSEKSVCAGFWHRNRVVFYFTPETSTSEI